MVVIQWQIERSMAYWKVDLSLSHSIKHNLCCKSVHAQSLNFSSWDNLLYLAITQVYSKKRVFIFQPWTFKVGDMQRYRLSRFNRWQKTCFWLLNIYSAETKYKATTHKFASFLKTFLQDLMVTNGLIKLYCYNNTISIGHNPVQHDRKINWNWLSLYQGNIK